MPMRRVPCEKAGIAVAANSPTLAAATRTRLNIHGSTVWRLPWETLDPVHARAKPRRYAARRLHACDWGGWDGFGEKATNTRRIPRTGGPHRPAADGRRHRASAQGLCRTAANDGTNSQPLGLGRRAAVCLSRRRVVP